MKYRIFFSLAFFLAIQAVSQKTLTVFADKPLFPIATTMWGVFFEDINFGADGGLYAELVKNKSFEFPQPLMGWREMRENYQKGRILIINRANESANSRFARITINHKERNYSLSNEVFRGIGLHKDKQYHFSMQARVQKPGSIKLKIQLLNSSGKEVADASLDNFSTEWTTVGTFLSTNDTVQRGKLNLVFEGEGVIDIDQVSLFPEETWKNRTNGLRQDLVQKIADLKPGFIRFPGGCIVEGKEL